MTSKSYTLQDQGGNRKVTVHCLSSSNETAVSDGGRNTFFLDYVPDIFNYFFSDDEDGKHDLFFTANLLDKHKQKWKLRIIDPRFGICMTSKILRRTPITAITMCRLRKRTAVFSVDTPAGEDVFEWKFEA